MMAQGRTKVAGDDGVPLALGMEGLYGQSTWQEDCFMVMIASRCRLVWASCLGGTWILLCYGGHDTAWSV